MKLGVEISARIVHLRTISYSNLQVNLEPKTRLANTLVKGNFPHKEEFLRDLRSSDWC